MWFPRLWMLVALAAAGLLLGGALTALPGAADEAAQVARRATAARTGELLAARSQRSLAERRLVAQLAARHPAVPALRGLLAEGLPEAVRASVVKQHLQQLARSHAGPTWVIFDEAGAVIGASEADGAPAGLAESVPAKAAKAGEIGAGLVAGRWVVAAPIEGKPQWTLVGLSPDPAQLIRSAHVALDDGTRLVVLRDKVAVSPGPEDAPLVAAAGPLDGAVEAEITVADAPWRMRRFSQTGVPGLSFALAWPDQPPTGWQTVGLAGIWAAAVQMAPITLYALGGAVALWLIGVALGLVLRRAAVRGVARQVALLGGDPDESVRAPGWLRPVVAAAEEALADARRRARPASSSTPPAEASAEISAEGRAEISAEGRAEISAEASASGERSGEVSAEISAEVSGESSGESSGERSGERSGEADAETHDVPAAATADASRDEPAGPHTVVRTGPPPHRPPAIEAELALEDPLDDALTRERRSPGAAEDVHGSLFEMPALRGVDALPDEDEPESDDVLGDADIRLPGASPSRPQGSLLAQLQRKAALEPERRAATPAPQREVPAVAPPTGESTQITPMPAALIAANEAADAGEPDDSREAYFHEVFEAFVATKAECGERTEGLEFTRFRSKLLRTRAALMDRFECHDVRFRVYVKDGKAALRAAPVLESVG